MAKKKTSQKKEAAPFVEPMAEPMSATKEKETVQRNPSPDRTEKLKLLNEILLKQTVEKREQVSQLKTQIEDMGFDFSFVSDTERDIFRVVLSAFVINLSIETRDRLRALEAEKEREIEKGRVLEERVECLEEELKDEMEKKRLVELNRVVVFGQLDMKAKEVVEMEKMVKELEREKLGLQEKISRVCDEKDGLLNDGREKEGLICNLRNEKAVIVKKLEECETLVAKLKVSVEEEIKDKSSKLSLLGNEKDELEKKMHDLGEHHKLEVSGLGSQIKGLKCKNTEKDREIVDLKATIDGNIEKIEGLNKEVEILQLAIEEAKKKGFWSWFYPAATTILAAVSFVYATRARLN